MENSEKKVTQAEPVESNKLKSEVLKSYGVFGTIVKVELPQLFDDEELRLYAAMTQKEKVGP